MRTGAILAAVLALALAGCGGGDGDTAARATTAVTDTETGTETSHRQPTGTDERTHAHDEDEEQALGPAATEASPEAPAEGPPSTGDLPEEDRSAVVATVSEYIRALNRHDAARVCALLLPGALDLSELPKRRGGCRSSLRASIGTPPRRGGPEWRRTRLVKVEADDLGDGRARVSASVISRFSDRKYVSVEDDVIYLQRAGPGWRLAKPSGTLYRAVGYPEPPLTSFTPPPGWA
jgi:hypothetical protein